MSAEHLRHTIQERLGDAYVIERELGGGGMSRVFVAEEIRFRRRVVIKLLPPELAAGVSAERFEREIRLASQLQQANIVPLINAGKAGEVSWYTMPFVDGESLRARLVRGPVPATEALSILRDMARALSYAHRHGVVHRDIKPENVLLSGGTAVITDFGIAKALAAARTTTDGDTLTVAGTSLGTPAYMAPEQALGEEVNASADLYAWGLVAYELLAGRHPFANRSGGQQLIAAHLTETPASLAAACPDLAGDVAALVHRCLLKNPDERPSSADELLAELDAHSTTAARAGASTAGMSRRRLAALATGAAVVLSTLVLVIVAVSKRWHRPPAAVADVPTVVVIHFDNQTGDGRLDAAGIVTADWIARGLVQLDAVQLLGMPNEITPAYDSIRRVHAAPGERFRALRDATGAAVAVMGEIAKRGDSLMVSARMVSTETGRVLQTFGPIASPPNDPVPAAATLRERVMGALAAEHGAGRLAGMTHNPPSYDAYREYVEGDRQFNVGRNAEAYRHYTAAARLDTTFTYALVRAAGAAYYATSVLSPSRCITVDSIQRVLAARQRLVSEYDERYLERVRSWCTGDWSAAFAAARRMAELAPRSEDAAYIAGRSALYLERPQSALQFFRRIDFNRGEWRGSDQALRDLTTAYHLLDDVDAEWTTLERSDLPIGSDVTRLRVRALAALHRGRAADSLVVEAEAAPRRAVEVYITAIGELRRHGEGAWSDSVAKRFVAYSARAPQQDAAYGRAVRGYALLLAHRDREAKQMFDSLVSVNFAPSRILGVAGVAAARLGDRPAADGFSRRLAEIAATVPQGEASYARAQIATALGRKEEAVELLRQALSEGIPYYFGIHFISSIHIDHADPLLQPLNGYAPYELLLHPKG